MILYEEVYILCLTMVDPGNKTHEDYMEKQTNKKTHTNSSKNKQKQTEDDLEKSESRHE